MLVLILNSGSSSIKFQVIQTKTKKLLMKGLFERIGEENSTYTVENLEKSIKLKNQVMFFKDHLVAIKKVLDLLIDKEVGVVNNLDEVDAIGHRVVHGGEYFKESQIVTDEVIKKIEEVSILAPLHNPANLKGIKICQELMPNKKNVVVFDTAFHQSIEKEKYIYPIQYKDYEDFKIRKYGFHGTSVRYITNTVKDILNKQDSKIIICHLGNGASITAVRNGKSIDTSMGFTPLAGIPMGTRCGDIDPSIVTYLAKVKKLSLDETSDYLNKQSGMLGIFGKSDNRDICLSIIDGDKQAELALNIFCNRIANFIGSYYIELEGLDAIIFTGGIGENSPETKENICNRLKVLGIEIDKEKNSIRNDEIVKLSTENSKIKVYKIPTNEELMIALDVEELIKK